MSQHIVQVEWNHSEAEFKYETFDRTHTIRFDGGTLMKGSSAKEYYGNPALIDPEEMLAASLASCHMLTFLAVAAKSRLVVQAYRDKAVAHLEKDEDGKMWVTRVELHPQVLFRGEVVSEQLHKLHEKAHKNCFIANSVKCRVEVHPSNFEPLDS